MQAYATLTADTLTRTISTADHQNHQNQYSQNPIYPRTKVPNVRGVYQTNDRLQYRKYTTVFLALRATVVTD